MWFLFPQAEQNLDATHLSNLKTKSLFLAFQSLADASLHDVVSQTVWNVAENFQKYTWPQVRSKFGVVAYPWVHLVKKELAAGLEDRYKQVWVAPASGEVYSQVHTPSHFPSCSFSACFVLLTIFEISVRVEKVYEDALKTLNAFDALLAGSGSKFLFGERFAFDVVVLFRNRESSLMLFIFCFLSFLQSFVPGCDDFVSCIALTFAIPDKPIS
jgi:hypothetical protein